MMRRILVACAVLLMGLGQDPTRPGVSAATAAAGVGSGRPDTLGLFRASAATYYLKNQNISGISDLTVPYGVAGDRPIVGDWNGDGRDTIGIHRNGVFYLRNANSSGVADVTVQYGLAGDTPLTGDWNGDEVDTVGIFRNGVFYLRDTNSNGPATIIFAFGLASDTPLVGDWDGDGVDGIGVYRASNQTFYLRNALSTGAPDFVASYGLAGDQPLVGDWDGDGRVTIGVKRGNNFHLRNTNTGGPANRTFAYGLASDTPVIGDWDATHRFIWRPVAASPVPRYEAQSAVVNGKFYVFGGFHNILTQATALSNVYDPATDTWTPIADMPVAVTHAGTAVDGQYIYIVGGFIGNHPGPMTDQVWRYNTVNNTWDTAPALPHLVGAGAAFRIGRNLHFVSGTNRVNGQYLGDYEEHYVLNLDGGTVWTPLKPLPNPRNHIPGVVLDGQGYVVGGQHLGDETAGNQASIHRYDPIADEWEAVADLPLPIGHLAASVFVRQGRLIAAGGVTQNSTELDDVIQYDPTSNTWIQLPPLSSPRQSPVADIIGDQVIVATGYNGSGVETEKVIGEFARTWETLPVMPVALGEVAGGVISNTLYVVGQGNAATLALDLATNTWGAVGALAPRPFVGDHHAAEVVNGKLYVLGGLTNGAGKVQIYDPVQDQWTPGMDMPFAAGSSSSAVINGEIYVAGGIIGASTTTQVAKYNPGANSWTSLTAMPQGRNHTAAATDGVKLYVFGGRGPGSGDANILANGFDTVQIYDPQTNAWQSSLDGGSTLAPLPRPRGGMGKAVYHNGEFYVMGGETVNGAGATPQGVFHRVDIYNPTTNTWRKGVGMPTARHGIFPLLHQGRIYIAGGGAVAGAAMSNLVEVYNPD